MTTNFQWPDDTRSGELEALRMRRAAVLNRLAAIRADVKRRLDRDCAESVPNARDTQVLDEMARVAERELEDVENRLGEVQLWGCH